MDKREVGQQGEVVGADVGPDPAAAASPAVACQDVVDPHAEDPDAHPRPLGVTISQPRSGEAIAEAAPMLPVRWRYRRAY